MTDHMKQNAASWWHSICDMLAAREAAMQDSDDAAFENATDTIMESILSVEIRDQSEPCEFMILLSTGSPALRIYGGLDEHGEPGLDPILQWQGWGTPWTDWWPDNAGDVPYKATLREFACCFYFGE